MSKEEQGKKMGRIISKAWADEAFKQRLLADAAAVLKAEGVAVPEGVTIKAVENTETTFHLIIPPKPSRELTEEELAVSAGTGCDCRDTCIKIHAEFHAW